MVQALEEILAKSSRIVFFGGAGVSTESGIPDFRSVDGLYHQKYDYPPETILSHTFWERNPEEFYRFYRDKLIVKGAKPNAAHLRLAKLEKQGKADCYVFGFEESYGYLTGSYVRDKDGVDGAYMICEMFSYYATQGISLLDKLDELYKTCLLYTSPSPRDRG